MYNYNTRKYFAAMSRPLIDLATACYGQGYTASEITALAQTEAYGPLSYPFATYAPDIVQAIFSCMEAGAELLTNGTTFVPAASIALASYDTNALTGIGVARKGSVFFKAAAIGSALLRFNATS